VPQPTGPPAACSCRPCDLYKYKFRPILYRVIYDSLLLRIGWRFILPVSPEAAPSRSPKHISKDSFSVPPNLYRIERSMFNTLPLVSSDFCNTLYIAVHYSRCDRTPQCTVLQQKIEQCGSRDGILTGLRARQPEFDTWQGQVTFF